MLQRLFYTALLYLLTPLVLYRLAARGIKYHGYFARWRERFGFFADPGIEGSLWIHASVDYRNPLFETIYPRLWSGEFTRSNLAMRSGLPGMWSLVPLAAIVTAALFLAAAEMKRHPSTLPSGSRHPT